MYDVMNTLDGQRNVIMYAIIMELHMLVAPYNIE